MPTADVTLLPPPFPSSSFDDEPHSAHSLEAVGVEAVLGAMIEQRRASQPSFASAASQPDAGAAVFELETQVPEDDLDVGPVPACGFRSLPEGALTCRAALRC